MANAHDSTGCQKCKKKFHNRLAALRTASKVEIEAADNISPIMAFSALWRKIKSSRHKELTQMVKTQIKM